MLVSSLILLAASLVGCSQNFLPFQDDPDVYYCGDLNNNFALAMKPQNFQGMTFEQVQNITSFFGVNLVNVDITNIDSILSLYQQCLSGSFDNAWIGYYQALEPPYGCSWTIGSNGHDVVSSNSLCANGTLPMIVQFKKFTTEANPSFTTTLTTTEAKSRTLRLTTTAATITKVVTLGNRVIRKPVTTTQTIYRMVGPTGKIRSLIPFSQCAVQTNNYTIVYNADNTIYPATYEQDCAFYNLIKGNLTSTSLADINAMLSSCTMGLAHVVFNSYDGYTPLCGLVDSDKMILNDFDGSACSNPFAALCFGGDYGSVTSVITVDTLPPTTTIPGATKWDVTVSIDNIATTFINRTKLEISIDFKSTRTKTVTRTKTTTVLTTLARS